MVIILKKAIVFLISICVCLSVCSCSSSKYSDKTVYFATKDSVSTLDPQLASTSAEITVASNCFEGLLTKNSDGKIVEGMAKKYSVSADKKTYTFTIRDDAVWSDGETKVTADDFLFGLQRTVKKSTNSPYVSSVFSIKNAKSINDGKTSMSKLGVVANGNTLTINLAKVDDGFLETLTKPLCFPCNREFFESTNGKYGLSKKDTLFNGAFYVSTYNKDEKNVLIYRNSEYNGEYYAVSQAISINYSEDYEDIYTNFEKNQIDVGTIECDYIKGLEAQGNSTKLFYNTNYVLYMSGDLKSSSGTDLRKALVTDIDYNTIKTNTTDYYKTVNGIIPSINTLDGKNYRDTVGGINHIEFNLKKAQKSLGDYNHAKEGLTDKFIYYPENNEKLELLSNLIVQGWQKDLDVFVNSKALDLTKIQNDVKSGEILMAILPVSGENNSAISSFNSLYDLKISENADGYSINKLYSTEKKLISSYKIYPLVSIPTAISIESDISKVNTSADGKIIDFRYITKK